MGARVSWSDPAGLTGEQIERHAENQSDERGSFKEWNEGEESGPAATELELNSSE